MSCWDTGDRQGYLLEPLIKNYKLWLDWQACQLDTPHWWEELTTIPEVGDLKKLALKICASFDTPAVRCEALQNHDYTAPLAPKCLTRDRFLPNDPSYQDVQCKPLLLTLAYAWALQYWAEEVSPMASGDPHPLAMSVVELRQHMGRYITFSNQGILKDLGSAMPEAQGWDTGIPQVDSLASPTMIDVQDT